VWPGLCYFPDFTRQETRRWWGLLYRDFLQTGIDGVWNDMNEPSVFNVPSKTMPEDNWHRADSSLGGPGPHARYHNVYGMLMVRATREGMLQARPNLRPFVLSRSNFLGGQRYAATWTGDNSANWDHLAGSIPMVLNLGLSGQPFAGPDIGGYAGNGPEGVPPFDRNTHFARWMGIATLLPFCRAHTEKNNVEKEPWSFDPATEATCRRAIERRYRLMPYLYTLFKEAAESGLPVARPVFFADPKNLSLRNEESSFLLGDSLLVSCRTTSESQLPAALPLPNWASLNLPMEDADPNLPRLAVRPGSIIPMGPVMQYVDEKPLDPLTLVVCLDENGEATGNLYEDAGDGYGYVKGDYRMTRFKAKLQGSEIKISSVAEGQFPALERKIEIVDLRKNHHATSSAQPSRVP
jgi:alpha-glucosidase